MKLNINPTLALCIGPWHCLQCWISNNSSGGHELLPQRNYRPASFTDVQIVKLIVNEIPGGAVLSLGVGSVPFTVASMIAQSDLRDIGCHTGTINDAFLTLYRAGN